MDLTLHGVKGINVTAPKVRSGYATRDIVIETQNATVSITVYCKAEDEEVPQEIQIKI